MFGSILELSVYWRMRWKCPCQNTPQALVIRCFHRAQTLAKLVDHGMPVQEVESVIPELLIAVLAFGCHRYANLRPLKIRDEADPFSMELGVTSKGDILRVLEVGDEMSVVTNPRYLRARLEVMG